jgi:hypothetical protein
VGVTFHQTILPGLLLYLMKGSFPRYSSLYFLVPVMCQGNQRPMKRILLIRLEETPPQTGLNEAAIPEMLIATSFFFNLRRPVPLCCRGAGLGKCQK